MNRIRNSELGVAVMRKELFHSTTGNVYSEQRSVGYVVYSYGPHFPMAVFVEHHGWHINGDKYSPTTTRHQSQCLSRITPARVVDTDELITLVQASTYDQWAVEKFKYAIAHS